MHKYIREKWQHSHDFLVNQQQSEKITQIVMISLVTHYPRSPEHYKNLLKHIPSIAHVTLEVNPCEGEPCLQIASIANHNQD